MTEEVDMLEEISDLDEADKEDWIAENKRIFSGMNTSEVNQEGNEDEKEEEPANLNLEPEHVVDALNKFEIVREKKALEELMGQSNKKKKVVKVEDEETRKNREAIKQRKYWELLTGILDT